MPIVHDKNTFRPAATLAKLPTKAQKDVLTAQDAQDAAVKLKYPNAPYALRGNKTGIAHFRNLVKQLHPDDFNNPILLDYIVQAALVWAKMQGLIQGLTDGTIPNTVAGSLGSPIRAPEFNTLAAFQTLYQNMLSSAGLKGANRLSNDDKVRAKAARMGKEDSATGGVKLTGNVHKDKGVMGLLARAKPK